MAWGNSSVKVFSQIELILKQSAVAICIDAKPKLIECDESAQIIYQKKVLYDKESFLGIYKHQLVDDKHITLFKSTQADGTDRYSGKIKYMGVVECPDWDPDPNRQCGGGLHLSPSESLALSYTSGKIKKCKVYVDDFVVYPHDITKVRCRKVEVVEG